MADQELSLTCVSEAYEDWEQEEERRRFAASHNRPQFEGLRIHPEIDFYLEDADRELCDRSIGKWGFDIHPEGTFYAAGFLLVFIALTLIFPDTASGVFSGILSSINGILDWVYALSINIFVVAALYFALSRCGKIPVENFVRSFQRCGTGFSGEAVGVARCTVERRTRLEQSKPLQFDWIAI